MHKICLRDFDGSCKGSAESGEWGRPIETKGKGRPMLENNPRIAGDAEIVDEAILSRRSVRAFLPDMVDDETIRAILAVAARAPSGTNMQPWKVYV
ncbi:nitroreductase, partial [Mesorhizobium sp. M7A.F.Ca.CA.002.05.1.1]